MNKKDPRPISEAREAEIPKLITNDLDAPEATDTELAHGKPFIQAFPTLSKKMRKAAGV